MNKTFEPATGLADLASAKAAIGGKSVTENSKPKFERQMDSNENQLLCLRALVGRVGSLAERLGGQTAQEGEQAEKQAVSSIQLERFEDQFNDLATLCARFEDFLSRLEELV